jgi:hypothetical protein
MPSFPRLLVGEEAEHCQDHDAYLGAVADAVRDGYEALAGGR